MKKAITIGTKAELQKELNGLKNVPNTSIWISCDGKKLIEVIDDHLEWHVKWLNRMIGTKCVSNAGYKLVGTRKGTKLIHRLVALAWCEKKDGCNEVDHIDGNKLNNHYANLEWVSHEENMQRAYANRESMHKHGYYGRYNKKTGCLNIRGQKIEMSYEEYIVWRRKHGLSTTKLVRDYE